MTRIRDFIATHPFTILGTSVGVLFALFLLVKVNRTDHEVQKIRDRVVVIERNIRNGKKQAERRIVCRPSQPHSRGCRELHTFLRQLSPSDRRKVQHGLRRARLKAHRPTQQRPHKPIADRPGAQPPARQPSPPSGGGQPGGGGSSSDGPSDSGLKVQVQTNPARVEVRAPPTSIQTPIVTVQVPPTEVDVQPPPLP